MKIRESHASHTTRDARHTTPQREASDAGVTSSPHFVASLEVLPGVRDQLRISRMVDGLDPDDFRLERTIAPMD